MSTLVKALRPLISKSPMLATLYRRWRDQRAFRTAPQQTVLGFRFNGNKAMELGLFEPLETRLVMKLLQRTGTLVNVGANVGYYCCLALHQGKRVVAFEPMPTNLHYLLRNVHVNGWSSGFECYPMALSDHIGVIEIFGLGTGASLIKGWSGQQNSTLIPVSTLDRTLGDRLNDECPLVLIDIEGAEFGMLTGASKLLSSPSAATWFVEICVAEHQPAGIQINPNLLKTFELFDCHGYAAISIDDVPRAIQLREVREIQLSAIDTLKTHNFIFVKRDELATTLAYLNE